MTELVDKKKVLNIIGATYDELARNLSYYKRFDNDHYRIHRTEYAMTVVNDLYKRFAGDQNGICG